MGVTYSIPEMKVKLQSTQYRCDRQINKRTNQLKVQRRTVANLLSEGKDETARIHVETILREEKIILAMERIKVMCMLVLNRVHTIGIKDMQTDDVVESLAGLVYARLRLPDLRELEEISAMLADRLGRQFIEVHQKNGEYKVPPALVALLEYKIPTLDVVFNTLKDIANEYSVTWHPKIANPNNFYDPNALGSIVSLDPVPPPGANPGPHNPQDNNNDGYYPSYPPTSGHNPQQSPPPPTTVPHSDSGDNNGKGSCPPAYLDTTSQYSNSYPAAQDDNMYPNPEQAGYNANQGNVGNARKPDSPTNY